MLSPVSCSIWFTIRLAVLSTSSFSSSSASDIKGIVSLSMIKYLSRMISNICSTIESAPSLDCQFSLRVCISRDKLSLIHIASSFIRSFISTTSGFKASSTNLAKSEIPIQVSKLETGSHSFSKVSACMNPLVSYLNVNLISSQILIASFSTAGWAVSTCAT